MRQGRLEGTAPGSTAMNYPAEAPGPRNSGTMSYLLRRSPGPQNLRTENTKCVQTSYRGRVPPIISLAGKKGRENVSTELGLKGDPEVKLGPALLHSWRVHTHTRQQLSNWFPEGARRERPHGATEVPSCHCRGTDGCPSFWKASHSEARFL